MSYESILVGSGELFVGPVNEAKPDVDTTPGGGWVSLGDIDGGVTVNLNETLDLHRIDNVSGAVKGTISEEDVMIAANLAESTVDNLAQAFDRSTPTADAGPPAIKTLGLHRGLGLSPESAILFRAGSPYGAFNAQFYLPRAVQQGSFGMAFTKDSKVLIPVEFMALHEPSASVGEELGIWEAQTS